MEFLSAWRGQRVLITGGTGLLGKHLCRFGAAAGIEIHNLSRHDAGLPDIVHHSADLRDAAAVKQIVQVIQPDGVIHAAAGGVAYGSSTFGDLLGINTIGLYNLLEALPDSVRATVIAGSGFEYAPSVAPLREDNPLQPFSQYGISKASGWMLANLYARRLSIRWLRLFSLYGVGEKPPRLTPYIIEEAAHGRTVELTAGEQIRDYLSTGDAAEGFWRALALSHPVGRTLTLNLGSGQPVTLRAFVEMLAQVLREHGIIPQIIFGARPYRPDEPMVYLPDVTTMTRVLGWQPVTSHRDGLTQMVEQQLEQT